MHAELKFTPQICQQCKPEGTDWACTMTGKLGLTMFDPCYSAQAVNAPCPSIPQHVGARNAISPNDLGNSSGPKHINPLKKSAAGVAALRNHYASQISAEKRYLRKYLIREVSVLQICFTVLPRSSHAKLACRFRGAFQIAHTAWHCCGSRE